LIVSNGVSGYKGVSTNRGKWQVKIIFDKDNWGDSIAKYLESQQPRRGSRNLHPGEIPSPTNKERERLKACTGRGSRVDWFEGSLLLLEHRHCLRISFTPRVEVEAKALS
jgi:hypothetical protein